jgi:hypothetical protein
VQTLCLLKAINQFLRISQVKEQVKIKMQQAASTKLFDMDTDKKKTPDSANIRTYLFL